MEPEATKVYEATQDFTIPKYTEEGNPDGEVSYTAGTKYEMPAEVAVLAPEGALKEVEEVPTPSPAEDVPQVEDNPTETGTPPVVEPTETAPANPGFVGGHTMADDERDGLPKH